MSRRRGGLRLLLLPFSLIYGIIVTIRNKLFDYNVLPSEEFDIPVISVGNITVGGTGKTPHIEYLIGILKDKYSVATLSRGYKRKTSGFVLADNQSKVQDIGDEPKQIKQKFPDIEVSVEKRRVEGIKTLMSHKIKKSLNVILLDDAYQHRYVKPGLSILLIDYNRPINKDFILPFGDLREKIHEKKRANIIMLTKCPEHLKPIERRLITKELNLFPYQNLFFTTFRYSNLKPQFNGDPEKEFPDLKGFSVVLITGIANADLLLQQIRKYTTDITHLKFGDHHKFSKRNIKKIIDTYRKIAGDKKIVLTTEKDAVRLKDSIYGSKLQNLPLYVIPVEVDFLYDKETFNEQILDYVRKNRRSIKSFKKHR